MEENEAIEKEFWYEKTRITKVGFAKEDIYSIGTWHVSQYFGASEKEEVCKRVCQLLFVKGTKFKYQNDRWSQYTPDWQLKHTYDSFGEMWAKKYLENIQDA